MVEGAGSGAGQDVIVSAKDPSNISFAQLCDLFEAIRGVNDTGRKGSGKKWKILDGWMAEVTKCGVNDRRTGFFALYRLMLPHIDKERSAYHLKEAALARVIGLALGLDRNRSPHFKKLEAWRKGGAGIFVDAVQECCAHHMVDGYVKRVDRATIGDVNDALDKLATLKTNNEKVPVVAGLMDNMDARQMRWLSAIIIKDMKLGYGEAAIIRHFHRDAEDLYNVCCDLRRVCETLHTKAVAFKRQDLQPGSLVRSMNAAKKRDCDEAWRHVQRREFVIEHKFDGERIQVHRVDARTFHYFTRNNFDFGPRGYSVMNRLFRRRLATDRCVLDGELVLWHKEHKAYVPFGYLKSFINAANRGSAAGALETARYRTGGGHGEEGEEEDGAGDDEDDEDRARISNHQFAYGEKPLLVRDLELVYVAFDVLYDTDHSVIDRPLRERHAILKRLFRPVPTQIQGDPKDDDDDDDSDGEGSGPVAPDGSVPLGPEGSGAAATREMPRGRVEVNVPASDGEAENPDCVVGSSRDDIERALNERIDKKEEGLVIKDLAAKWTPGERGPGWIKIKPDYLPTEDLDVVIIGGFYGTGVRRGGKIAEYLLGIVETPSLPDTQPTHVVSFSKVGIGMSEDVLDKLRRRLDPHMIEAKRGVRPPRCYKVTGRPAEHPDVWISDPGNSVVMTVKADIRIVRTATFYSQWSLRFPRCVAVRWDKHWADCLDTKELEAKVEGGIGIDQAARAAGRRDRARGEDGKPAKRCAKTSAPRDTAQPGHLAPARTDHVHVAADFLSGVDARVITGGGDGGARAAEKARELKQELCELIKRHGGAHSEAQHAGVTHVICDPSATNGVAFNAAKKSGLDVLTPGWLRDCVDAGAVIEPRPKHRLHLSRGTVELSEGRVDAFGDDHLVDVDTEDAAALVAGERVANAAARLGPEWDPTTLEREMEAVGPAGAGGGVTRGGEVEPWRAFRGCVVAFVESGEGGESEYETRRALELCVALRGGACKRWEDVPRGTSSAEAACTHVVLMDGVGEAPGVVPPGARVVTARWLRETLETAAVG